MSIWDDEDEEWFEHYSSTFVRQEKKTPKRTVRYAGPGHTVVGYRNRILDINFKQSALEFNKVRRNRRSKASKKGAKNRTARASYYDGEYTYSQRRNSDVGMNRIREKQLANDEYTKEDMRALLKDAHWEEVCGHSRWKYDNKSLVKEFNKYQKEYQRMM